MTASIFDFNTALKQEQQMAPVLDPEGVFRDKMAGRGLFPHGAITSGGFQRFRGVEDSNGGKSGYYIFFPEHPQGGVYGDWKLDFEEKWSLIKPSEMTPQQSRIYKERMAEARRLRDAEMKERRAGAQEKALQAWEGAGTLTVEHPYLQVKGVEPYGARLLGDSIIWPLRDYDGVVHSYQTIAPNGDKRFLSGGMKKGCYFEIPGSHTVGICEGFATAASVHKATGWTTVVAADAGNLAPVATEWRKSNPAMKIVICGDNDASGVGQKKAMEAAELVGGLFKIPEREGDWNDVHATEGVGAVKAGLATRSYRTPITDWGIERFEGPAPEREWLVASTIPAASLTILSAQGDAGKGMLLLDLGLKVAGGDVGGKLQTIEAFGNTISSHGAVVILTAEDDKDEMHRRVEGIRKGRELKHPLYIVPLPNAGGPMPFVEPGANGPKASTLWHEMVEQINDIPDIKLIVIDPLASFVMADVNSDPAVGAFTTGLFASLATGTGAALIVAHHLAKTTKRIASPEDARALVRGSTAIVDGARSVYVLWGVDEKSSKTKCKHLGVEWQRNRIFYGCLVKSNGPGDRNIKTYSRNDAGLLEVVDSKIQQVAKEDTSVLLDMLLDDIEWFASQYHPFSRTGQNGVWEQKQDLNSVFKDMSQRILRGHVETLLKQKRIVTVAPKGSKNKNYLDVPGGTFSEPEVELLGGEKPSRW